MEKLETRYGSYANITYQKSDTTYQKMGQRDTNLNILRHKYWYQRHKKIKNTTYQKQGHIYIIPYHRHAKTKGVKMANEANLKHIQSTNEARALGRIGGIASGYSRREKKLLKQVALEILQKRLPNGRTVQENLLNQLVTISLDPKVKTTDLIKTIETLRKISGQVNKDGEPLEPVVKTVFVTPAKIKAIDDHIASVVGEEYVKRSTYY